MVTKEFKFENGDRVKDVITGQEGTITGTCFYITGCDQYLVTSKQSDKSKEAYSCWRDEARLELIKSRAIVLENNRPDAGPDMTAPIK